MQSSGLYQRGQGMVEYIMLSETRMNKGFPEATV